MPNERDDHRSRGLRRDRDDGDRWRRDRDEPWRERDVERGDYGRFREDEDAGGRGRSLWGGGDSRRWRDDDDRGMRGRDQLPSVGSPGVGGGTGGWWDQHGADYPEDRDRGGEELRYGRGGTHGGGAGRARWGRGRDWEDRPSGDQDWPPRAGRQRDHDEPGRGRAGWGRAGMGMGDEDWSPAQTSVERMGRGWGGSVGRDLPGSIGVAGMGRDRAAPWLGGRGFAGKGPMNYVRSDQRIHEDVCDALTEDDEVDASTVEVKVERGEVTLTGTIAARDMKRRAEALAEQVAGVQDVHNQLRVRERPAGEAREDRAGVNGNGGEPRSPH
jgi:hypothetical protein